MANSFLSIVIPGCVKRRPGIQNRELSALDSGFSGAAPERRMDGWEFKGVSFIQDCRDTGWETQC